MIDLHSHLMPAVDDGAASLEDTHAALAAMRDDGVRALITTPHLTSEVASRADLREEALARFDAAWAGVCELAAREFPELRVERGVELMLVTRDPDLSDRRVRLAGTSFVLVEFAYMRVPPNSVALVSDLRRRGYRPVIAHPERYADLDDELEVVGEWRRAGAALQLNCGSLLGRYGKTSEANAWRLLEKGWADYLSSDYHARGPCGIRDARARLEQLGGTAQAAMLFSENPERVLLDLPPEAVPPLETRRRSLWRRLIGGDRA